jgi:hypothetical protein
MAMRGFLNRLSRTLAGVFGGGKRRRSVRELARRYLAGELSAEQVASFSGRLSQDRAARREFASVLLRDVQSSKINEEALWHSIQQRLKEYLLAICRSSDRAVLADDARSVAGSGYAPSRHRPDPGCFQLDIWTRSSRQRVRRQVRQDMAGYRPRMSTRAEARLTSRLSSCRLLASVRFRQSPQTGLLVSAPAEELLSLVDRKQDLEFGVGSSFGYNFLDHSAAEPLS